eukprot:10100000-Alexandrium_andersonii.AAC.1
MQHRFTRSNLELRGLRNGLNMDLRRSQGVCYALLLAGSEGANSQSHALQSAILESAIRAILG